MPGWYDAGSRKPSCTPFATRRLVSQKLAHGRGASAPGRPSFVPGTPLLGHHPEPTRPSAPPRPLWTPRWFPQLGSKKGNRDPIQTWVGPRRGRWPGAPLKAYSRAPASLAAVTQGQRRGPSGSSQDVAGRVRGGAGRAPAGREGAGGGAAKWRHAGAGPTIVRASRHAARRPAVGGAGVGGDRKQAEPASPNAAYASGNLEPGSRVFR